MKELVKVAPRLSLVNTADGDAKALAAVVAKMHGAPVCFVGSVPVHERSNGATLWKGMVSTFELPGHPRSLYCYAWLVPATNDTPQRHYAVLHTAQVDSPEKAVHATTIVDRRKNNDQKRA